MYKINKQSFDTLPQAVNAAKKIIEKEGGKVEIKGERGHKITVEKP